LQVSGHRPSLSASLNPTHSANGVERDREGEEEEEKEKEKEKKEKKRKKRRREKEEGQELNHHGDRSP
jgi:hypothetical protein